MTRTIILTDHIIIKSNEIKIKGSRFQNRFFQGEKNLLIGLLCCVSPPPMAIAAIRLRLLASSEPVPEFVGAWTTTIGVSLVVNTGEFEVSRDIPGNSIIDKILSSVVVVLFERATTDDRVSCRRKLKMSRERRSEAENKIDCTIFTLDIFFILKSGRFIFVRFFFSKFSRFLKKKRHSRKWTVLMAGSRTGARRCAAQCLTRRPTSAKGTRCIALLNCKRFFF